MLPKSNLDLRVGRIFQGDDEKTAFAQELASAEQLQAIVARFGEYQVDQSKNDFDLLSGFEEVHHRLEFQNRFAYLVRVY